MATVAVIAGVLPTMSFWMRLRVSIADHRPHRLDPADVARTFVKWASEASPERRALVHNASEDALDNFGKYPAASTDR